MEKQNFYEPSQELFLNNEILFYLPVFASYVFWNINIFNMKILRSRIQRVEFSLQMYATITASLWHPEWQGFVW